MKLSHVVKQIQANMSILYFHNLRFLLITAHNKSGILHYFLETRARVWHNRGGHGKKKKKGKSIA